MSSKTLIQALIDQHQIRAISLSEKHQLILKENSSLERLIRQRPSYLNRYDQLFRYVSLWLLHQGYALTDHQPHQTLLGICEQWACEQQIRNVIYRRHQLKKRECLQPPTLAEENTLRALIVQVQQQVSQAC